MPTPAPKRIGEYLVDRGLLKAADVDRVLDHGRRHGLRFGESAMALGVLTRDDLVRVFGPRFQVDFLHLDPAYYPRDGRDVFTVDAMVRFGMLTVGFKDLGGWWKRRRALNVGLLDPDRADARKAAELVALQQLEGHGLAGVKFYLVLAEEFLRVLESAYGVAVESLRSRAPEEIDPTLRLFLDR